MGAIDQKQWDLDRSLEQNLGQFVENFDIFFSRRQKNDKQRAGIEVIKAQFEQFVETLDFSRIFSSHSNVFILVNLETCGLFLKYTNRPLKHWHKIRLIFQFHAEEIEKYSNDLESYNQWKLNQSTRLKELSYTIESVLS